jgi:pyruvate decarboxylase
VIQKCYFYSRPVYIYLPLDMVHKPVPTSALEKPFLLGLLTEGSTRHDATVENAAVEKLLFSIYSSKTPVVLVDGLILQFGLKSVVRSLLDYLKFPTFCPFMGKSIIQETKPYFHGTYNGKFSYPGIQKAVEKDSDLVIHIGPLPTDMNTGGFSAKVDIKKLVLVQETKVIIKGEVFEGAYLESCKSNHAISFHSISLYSSVIHAVLKRLYNSLDVSKVPKTTPLELPTPPSPDKDEAEKRIITQSYLWPRIGKLFRSGDIVFADGGTTHFGLQDAEFPDITYIMQNY